MINKTLSLILEESFWFLKKHSNSKEDHDYGDWEERKHEELAKIFNEKGELLVNNLENFRGRCIYVSDSPSRIFKGYQYNNIFWDLFLKVLHMVIGSRRASVKTTMASFQVLKEMGFLQFLKKYPNPSIGKPFNLNVGGYQFTDRYLRHIYILATFKQQVEPYLPPNPVIMDIGCSYGAFSSLVKRELHTSRHVLVDMPGQLVLAHYYLASLFPKAKIADFKAVIQADRIDRAFIDQYDFVLLPASEYNKLTCSSIDLVTNFISFAEMSREWFHVYLDSTPVKSASLLYTINRYDSHPTYNNNLTVLDYPLQDYDTLFMRTCPLFSWYFQGRALFWSKKVRYPSDFFQFVGRRHEQPPSLLTASPDQILH